MSGLPDSPHVVLELRVAPGKTSSRTAPAPVVQTAHRAERKAATYRVHGGLSYTVRGGTA